MPISVREFKAHLSKYVAEARAGRPVVISSHRKVVARLVGVAEETSPGVEQLLVSGAAEWGGGKPEGGPIDLSSSGKSVSQMVLEDRG